MGGQNRLEISASCSQGNMDLWVSSSLLLLLMEAPEVKVQLQTLNGSSRWLVGGGKHLKLIWLCQGRVTQGPGWSLRRLLISHLSNEFIHPSAPSCIHPSASSKCALSTRFHLVFPEGTLSVSGRRQGFCSLSIQTHIQNNPIISESPQQ